ncbi:MAG: hypothetical protein O3C32_06530, partial [Bacteroidetes bacterium]|nr:hypothetical protein [Bacteroidota bacterium]
MIYRFLLYLFVLSHSIAGFSQLYPNDSRSTQIDVLHYDLTLDFRQFSPFVLKGHANIQVLPLLPLDSIEFDLKGLAVDSVKLGQAPLPFLQLGSQEKVRLYFSPPLQD